MIIANHSHTHPMFDQCNSDELKYELQKSTEVLESMDYQAKVFAYPNGNFDPTAEQELIKEGVKMAFLFAHKLNEKNINPLRIFRIRVDSDTNLKEFKVKVSGLHSFIYHNFRKKIK